MLLGKKVYVTGLNSGFVFSQIFGVLFNSFSLNYIIALR